MSWQTTRRVEFAHCDPAGMVFYPRYFEMINSVIEQFFHDHVGQGFAPMHFEAHKGVPTVKISSEYHHPSRLGDVLSFDLAVVHLGQTSLGLKIDCTCNGELRFVTKSTLVRTDLALGTADPWPDDLRARLQPI